MDLGPPVGPRSLDLFRVVGPGRDRAVTSNHVRAKSREFYPGGSKFWKLVHDTGTLWIHSEFRIGISVLFFFFFCRLVILFFNSTRPDEWFYPP